MIIHARLYLKKARSEINGKEGRILRNVMSVFSVTHNWNTRPSVRQTYPGQRSCPIGHVNQHVLLNLKGVRKW